MGGSRLAAELIQVHECKSEQYFMCNFSQWESHKVLLL